MPKYAIEPAPELDHLRDQLKHHLQRHKISMNAFAQRHRLTQSTVHRFLTGRTKRLTPAVLGMLAYAEISIDQSLPSAPISRILKAIQAHWGGRAETVDAVAGIIEVLVPALTAAFDQSIRGADDEVRTGQ